MHHQRVVGILIMLVLTQGCLAADRNVLVQQTPQQLLSDVLPGALGKFVERVGANRPVKDVSAENLASFLSHHPNLAAVLDILRPRGSVSLSGPATLVKGVARPEPRDQTGALETLLVAGGIAELNDGSEVALGGTLALGSVVRRGLILNAGQTDVVIETEEGESILAPGEAVWLRCLTHCSIGCPSGYYACCWENDGCVKCKCLENGTPHDCDAGGEPATGCSVGQPRAPNTETTHEEAPTGY